jgi:hypothetical protein
LPSAFYFYTILISPLRVKLLLCLILCLPFPVIVSLGQKPWSNQRDSFLHRLSQEADDTNKVWTLRDMGVMYFNYDQRDSGALCAKAAGALSEKIHFLGGMAISLSMQASVISDSNVDEAIPMEYAALG